MQKQYSKILDHRIFTHFFRRWVPEISDTKKYQNKKNHQYAEQSTDLASFADLSCLSWFCLSNYKITISSGLLTVPRNGENICMSDCYYVLSNKYMGNSVLVKKIINLHLESDSPQVSPENSFPWSLSENFFFHCVETTERPLLRWSYKCFGLYKPAGRNSLLLWLQCDMLKPALL